MKKYLPILIVALLLVILVTTGYLLVSKNTSTLASLFNSSSPENPPAWAYGKVQKYLVEKLGKTYVDNYFALQEARIVSRSQLDSGFIPENLQELYRFTYHYKHPYHSSLNDTGTGSTCVLEVYPDGTLIPGGGIPAQPVIFKVTDTEARAIAQANGLDDASRVIYAGVWDLDSDPWHRNAQGQLQPSKTLWRDYVLQVTSGKLLTLPGGSKYFPAVYLRADTGEVIATNLVSKESLRVIDSYHN